TGDMGCPTTLLRHVLYPLPQQHRLDVSVAETVDMVFATQHSAEQLLLLHPEQIQAPSATLAQTGRFVYPVEDLHAGLGPVHDRQCLEVAVVRGPRDLMVVVEVGHAFIHGAPVHPASSLALEAATDLELTRVVDDCLDA